MTTNKPNVQRYRDMGAGQICPINNMLKSDDGNYVLYEDYEALKAENEELRQQVETFQGLKPAMPPMPPTGEGLPRYGLKWNGPSQPLSVPMDDGYWTPWHLAQAECEKLRELLLQSAPIVHAHAGASHMLEGFRPRRNKWDALVEQIDAALAKATGELQ